MRAPDFPTRVQIEINNFCNATCIMCPVATMKRKRETMDFALFEKVINRIKVEKKSFRGWILPFLSGDPFLVPNYLDYLRLIREKLPRAKIAVDTNASRLTFEKAEEIIDEVLLDRLTMSFDGGTKKAYESIRRGLSFEKVRDNIHHFLHLKNQSKKKEPLTRVKMILTKENFSSRKQFTLLFKDADRVIFSSMHNWGGQIFRESPSLRSNFCSSIFQTFTILTNGNVVLCCVDYEGSEKMGNVLENSIKEIWMGKEFQKRRKYLSKRKFDKLPLCRNCSILDRNIVAQQMAKIKALMENKFPNYTHNNRVLQWDSFREFYTKRFTR